LPIPLQALTFKFRKCSQFFIRTRDETLSVALRVSNADCSPLAING